MGTVQTLRDQLLINSFQNAGPKATRLERSKSRFVEAACMSSSDASEILDAHVPFIKMQGAGNDFVVLDLCQTPIATSFDFVRASQTLCDRHFGVGSDGLLTLEPARARGAQARMRMWNPDGSEDMCGNGLRCVAALAWARGHVNNAEFKVETLVGVRAARVLGEHLIRTAMGHPRFAPEQVPFVASGGQERLVESTIEVGGETLPFATSVSTGSTHTVIFREETPDEALFQRLSPLLEYHPLFPQRTSILWAVPLKRKPLQERGFRIRIWERGVGETLACGTGACAVAVAANITGRANGPVEVESRGGVLKVEWNAPDGEMFLTGPAQTVFEGVWCGDAFEM